MKGKYFLDTNILVYSFDEGATSKQKLSIQLIRKGIDAKKGVISFQVVQEFLNVAFRKFKAPFTVRDAEQYFASVLRPLLTIQSSPALYLEGLRLGERYKIGWYDSLVVAAALEARCDILYSEDLQHGQRFEQLRVVNPFTEIN
jgi:predicted nucleic acid-binding protein